MALFHEREAQGDEASLRLLARLFKNIGRSMLVFFLRAACFTYLHMPVRPAHTKNTKTYANTRKHPNTLPDTVLLNDLHLSEALIQRDMFLELAAVMECAYACMDRFLREGRAGGIRRIMLKIFMCAYI